MKIRINYDNNYEEICDKFVNALQKLGIFCKEIGPEDEEATYIEYEISLEEDVSPVPPQGDIDWAYHEMEENSKVLTVGNGSYFYRYNRKNRRYEESKDLGETWKEYSFHIQDVNATNWREV